MRLDGTMIGKFGRAGKLLKEFGTVNAIDCRSENTLYVGEVGNFRVQKLDDPLSHACALRSGLPRQPEALAPRAPAQKHL